jgi:MYXO-CTERM domain-containing protein
VPRAGALAVVVLLLASRVGAQGTVQAHDPRRPPPLEPGDRCEVWEGTISGNDPTAQASMQVCALEGARVRGVFLWSSLQSGWDRRAFEGAWSADGQTLTLRDTHMIESHPMNGWMLCTADRYELRRTVPTRLDGTYVSTGCSDRGTLSLLLRGTGTLPEAPPHADASAVPVPAEPPRVRRPRCGCEAGSSRSPGALLGLALAAAITLRRRRAR